MASASPSARAYLFESLKTIVDILQDISNDIPAPGSTIINLVQHVITIVEEIQNNREECDLLRDRLLELLPVVTMALQKHRSRSNGQAAIPLDLKQNIEHFLMNLKTIDAEVTKIKDVVNSKRKRHKLTAVFWVKSHTATLQKCRNDLDWAMQVFEVSSRLDDAVRLWETSRKVETVLTNQFLEALPRAKYASFDCERPDKPSTCFEGTRTAILQLITDWITNPDPTAPRFFWLNGLAGVGKTTVACTIAGLMQNLGLLGGQFCFSRRGEAELRNPALVFPTIAYQLARFDPEFGRRITEAVEAHPEAAYSSLKQQLDRLIIDPLSGLERDSKRVVVLVLDAFDECEARGAKEILQLLIAAMPSLPFFLKIFVTSRPENHIRSVLVPAAHAPGTNLRMTALHDIETSIVKSDILLYLRDRLRKLPEELGLDLPPDWITDVEIELLADKAGNLSIHAATALRFLSKGFDLREQLNALISIITSLRHSPDSAQPFAELDQLYMQILLALIPSGSGPHIPSHLRFILGSIALLRDPLPVDALEKLVGLDAGKAVNTLRHLHSVVLTPPPPDDCPRVYHPSFPDFLQDQSRCPDGRLWIDTQEHEGRMALRCLSLLNAKLHKGMLGDLDTTLLNSEIEDLAAKVQKAFPPELQYACCYWASHLANASPTNGEVRAALEVFVSKTMLPWKEAISWLEETGLGIRSLESANAWVAKDSTSQTTALLYEGYRLLLAHISTVAGGAQHIAQSVLPFVPRDVALAAAYDGYANTRVKVIRGVDPEWSASLMVWTGHQTTVNSVAFSPDGSRAASGSKDKTIRLWDAITGSCITTLRGQSGFNSVAFSPDGTYLASGSDDRRVRLWDAITGTCVAVLEGHSGVVTSVVFSLDGSILASGSTDKCVRLWGTATWSHITTLEGHAGTVRSIAFSPDGLYLASGSSDKTIRVWNATAGACKATLEGHSSSIHCVAFSPDGFSLASGSDDRAIRTWDIASGRWRATVDDDSHGIASIAFSPDFSRLASVWGELAIRIWDTTTSQHITTFRGHSDAIASVAFSFDGLRLISGSLDNTVRLWDAAVSNAALTSEGHSDWVTSVAFSPDGSSLASASWDGTLRVWDTTTGACVTTYDSHSDKLETVAFSTNGSHIRYMDGDGEVYLMDMATGKQVEAADDNKSDHHWDNRFKIFEDDCRLVRSDGDDSEHLVCLLPPGTMARSIASCTLSTGEDLVAIGCLNGDLFILKISSDSS